MLHAIFPCMTRPCVWVCLFMHERCVSGRAAVTKHAVILTGHGQVLLCRRLKVPFVGSLLEVCRLLGIGRAVVGWCRVMALFATPVRSSAPLPPFLLPCCAAPPSVSVRRLLVMYSIDLWSRRGGRFPDAHARRVFFLSYSAIPTARALFGPNALSRCEVQYQQISHAGADSDSANAPRLQFDHHITHNLEICPSVFRRSPGLRSATRLRSTVNGDRSGCTCPRDHRAY
jgi:hypothetical protein